MQNHNVKFKNSAYQPIRPKIAENPGAPGVDLKRQSQFAPVQMGAKSFAGERYENKPRPGLRENKANQSQIQNPPASVNRIGTEDVSQWRD